jgi:hypothetical protein
MTCLTIYREGRERNAPGGMDAVFLAGKIAHSANSRFASVAMKKKPKGHYR